ncbi:MAG: hypothetical protein JO101_07585 [Candidatus Eremiobacteraeota bacterium]|nr:hypothetical protein [Candidatus Eremiobacteraeota bacterium]
MSVAHSASSSRHVELSRIQNLRIAFIFLVACFALGRTLPDAIRVAFPLTVFGYLTDASGRITTVFPHGPAARAHLQAGDRIDVHDFNIQDRKSGLIGSMIFSAYNPVRHMTIVRDGVRMSVEVVGVHEPMQTRLVILLREIVAFITIAIAALLAIVRPNRATLGFFHFIVGGEVYPNAYTSIWLDYPWRMVVDSLNDVLVAGSTIGLLMFALGFPRDLPVRWRIPVDAAGMTLWAIMSSLLIYSQIGSTYFARDAVVQDQTYTSLQILVALSTLAVFLVTLVRSRGSDRVRVAWVVAAFVLTILGEVISVRYYPGFLKYWQYSTLQLLPIVPAVTVFYSVTRYHMMGIDFYVNRAIVYAAMTVAIVLMVGVTEEGLGYWFAYNTNVTYAVLLGIMLVLGFFFTHIRDAIHHVVDRSMFRDRVMARERLDALAHALPHAESREQIESALTADVREALDLRCAALLENRGDSYVVVADAHWPPTAATIPADDPVLTRIVHAGIADFLRERDWVHWSEDLRPVTPRVAVPIEADTGSDMVAIYGLEQSGVDLDVDEVRALERLATGAAVGYTNLRTREIAKHLDELMELREENVRLRERLEAYENGKVSAITESPRLDT